MDLTLNTHLSARTMRHPLHPPSSLPPPPPPPTHTHTHTHTATGWENILNHELATTRVFPGGFTIALPLGFSLQAGGPLPAKYHITPWPPARTTTTLASNLLFYISVIHISILIFLIALPGYVPLAAVPCHDLGNGHSRQSTTITMAPAVYIRVTPPTGLITSRRRITVIRKLEEISFLTTIYCLYCTLP